MTICEKFKLMMASFADIRAAIAEKGGTVTGGYADYAKNIRNLYSNDTYAPQYKYPTEKSPIMQYLINLYNRHNILLCGQTGNTAGNYRRWC